MYFFSRGSAVAGTANIGNCASSRWIGNGRVHGSRHWHVASAKEKGEANASIGPSIGSTVEVAGTLVVVGDAAPVVVSVRAGTPMSNPNNVHLFL